MGQLRLQG